MIMIAGFFAREIQSKFLKCPSLPVESGLTTSHVCSKEVEWSGRGQLAPLSIHKCSLTTAMAATSSSPCSSLSQPAPPRPPHIHFPVAQLQCCLMEVTNMRRDTEVSPYCPPPARAKPTSARLYHRFSRFLSSPAESLLYSTIHCATVGCPPSSPP
jgi:hypothetical protein